MNKTPVVAPFFDPATFTWTYVVTDAVSRHAAVIDPVLDYDPASGRLSSEHADRVIDYVRTEKLSVDWILETHVHADHLTGASYLKPRLGGKVGIGNRVGAVQEIFGDRFNAEPSFARDGSQFDMLFSDASTFSIGQLEARVMHTPGHTPACVTYVIGDAAFVGDTLFMPDYGTARTDFPGGSAHELYRSIRRILELPGETRLFMCHDYGSDTRSDFAFQSSVSDERRFNKLINDSRDEAAFVAEREARDAKMAAPRLLLPSVQFNMRGGHLPPAEANGLHYFKIPLHGLTSW